MRAPDEGTRAELNRFQVEAAQYNYTTHGAVHGPSKKRTSSFKGKRVRGERKGLLAWLWGPKEKNEYFYS